MVCGISCSPAQGTVEGWVELGHAWNRVIEDRRAGGDGTVGLAERTRVLAASLARRTVALMRGTSMGDAAVEDEDAGSWSPRTAAIATMRTSRPATRTLRIRVRRGALRAGAL